MKEYTKIQKTAYEKYKLDWMLRHGYTLSDVWEIFTELAGEEIDDNPEDIPINSSETILFADKLRNRFLTDVGFNGSVFACIDEFLENEYTDIYYISRLLSKKEYEEYISETVIRKQDKVSKDFSNLKIAGITLLSAQEVENLPKQIRLCKTKIIPEWWWLRTPGDFLSLTTYVYIDGSIYYRGDCVSDPGCVRPALKITNLKSCNLKLYDTINLFNRDWIVISENTVLCQKAIGRTAFRAEWNAPDANDYEKSDIKKYLEHWLKEQLATSWAQCVSEASLP